MANTYWNIDSGDGNELSAGIQSEIEARRIAQSTANRLGQSVYLYEVGNGDGESEAESEEIEPANVTNSDIEALASAAGAHGDSEQVALCEAGLNGDAAARAECIRVIYEARARADS
jgi:hypothetical protein